MFEKEKNILNSHCNICLNTMSKGILLKASNGKYYVSCNCCNNQTDDYTNSNDAVRAWELLN